MGLYLKSKVERSKEKGAMNALTGLCRLRDRGNWNKFPRNWILLVGIGITILVSAVSAQEEGETEQKVVLSKAEKDTLLARGEQQMLEGASGDAVITFTRLVEAYPEDAALRSRLGYAYLKRRDFKAAEKTFKTAKNLDATRPDAYVGLGLVYVEGPGRGLNALFNSRRARGEARRAIRIDSTYAPAYRLLGELYERFWQDHEKAIHYYEKYVALEPDNVDGLYYFGLACVQGEQYSKINTYLTPHLKPHLRETRLIPLIAQGYFFLERYETALEQFERYLQKVDDQERQHYTDISLVASEREFHAYQAISDSTERLDYLEKFWLRRDSDILTRINERIIEHYRRVWYARTFFSKKVFPWDKRGEVYIRYGEPDYRSSKRQLSVSPEVEAVRTRMAVDLYGPAATYLTFTGPVFPIRSSPRRPDMEFDIETGSLDAPGELEETVGPAPAEAEGDANADMLGLNPTSMLDELGNPNLRLTFENYAPVTMERSAETVPWETWTYTQLQGGVEFTFTDEFGSGDYEFARVPPIPTGENKLANAARMLEYAPGTVFQRTIAQTPDYYRPSIRGAALHFYYDLADFRGSEGQTNFEVYYGIPPREVEIVKGDEDFMIRVQSSMALMNEDYTHIYRATDEFFYQNSKGFSQARGVFVPDQLRVQVPPGKYELQVQLKDRASGRIGIYKQSVEVPDYALEGLHVSGIQLASSIGGEGTNNRFRKGELWVVPVPSRTYTKEQKVYAYFEIYNLKRNDYGQTRYKVKYLVRFTPEAAVGIAGAITTGLRSLFKRRKPQVSVTYEQIGTEQSEYEYVELDLRQAKAGVNVLEITVEDLVSGEVRVREVVFYYGGTPG
ncbi:MAG: GWxTD domain-containing protein [Gemmatimonadetes bacterium]|nr:GWxTD domain-containing protein [Gemmatimonadota bacterium]